VILGGFVVVVAGSALAAAEILAHADAAIAEQVAVRVRKRRIGFQSVCETSFPQGLRVELWALLLTVKQDTVKTSNQILDTLWEALSG
jgi:transposase